MMPLEKIRAFMLDMDGTIYLGAKLFPETLPFFDTLRRQGRRFLLLTNNSSLSRRSYVRKVQRLGIPAAEQDILTSGIATVTYLEQEGMKRIYLLGTPDLEQEFREGGFELTERDPDAVVLGFDRTLSYAKLEVACLLIRAGVPFIATHPDLTCPVEYGAIPDCGAMIALIEAATGVFTYRRRQTGATTRRNGASEAQLAA